MTFVLAELNKTPNVSDSEASTDIGTLDVSPSEYLIWASA